MSKQVNKKMKSLGEKIRKVAQIISFTLVVVLGSLYVYLLIIEPLAAYEPDTTVYITTSAEEELLELREGQLRWYDYYEKDYGLIEETDNSQTWKQISEKEGIAFEIITIYEGNGYNRQVFPDYTPEELAQEIEKAQQAYEEALAIYEASLEVMDDLTE